MTDVSQMFCFRRSKAGSVNPKPILPLLLLCFATLGRAQDLFPLGDIRPGLKGVGRTVFHGNQVEEFQVQILGVLENLTPRQTIILAKLSGGPLEQTGVMQGMSGSPVYIDGKLVGAVALGFPYAKEAIAGIQPIEQMLSAAVPPERANRAPRQLASTQKLTSFIPSPEPSHTPTSLFGGMREIFTPLSLSGFTPRTLQAFSAGFQSMGFDPQQGVSSGAPTSQAITGTVAPGSMISVQLLSGDLAISADGTVTYINGKQIYAFGHRFLDSGTTEMPFARADVIALLPTLNSSFKLSAAREWVGTITNDVSTAVYGTIGQRARTIPMTIAVQPPSRPAQTYHVQVVNDRLLTPFITQAAVFSTIDATQRTAGTGSIRLHGRIDFEGGLPSLSIADIFVSETGAAQQASVDAVVPLTFLLGGGFQDLRIKQITFTLEPMETKRQLRVAQAWTSRSQVRPGESVEVNFLLQGENGYQITKSAQYRVPVGAPLGGLNITVSDALTLNSPDFAGISQSSLHSPAQLIEVLNQYRGSDAAYVRFWRQQPSFTISGPMPGGELTDPPPSISLILADVSCSPTSSAASTVLRGSQVAEVKVPTDSYAVIGARTVQVEVID